MEAKVKEELSKFKMAVRKKEDDLQYLLNKYLLFINYRLAI
jgi:hypothetical protein